MVTVEVSQCLTECLTVSEGVKYVAWKVAEDYFLKTGLLAGLLGILLIGLYWDSSEKRRNVYLGLGVFCVVGIILLGVFGTQALNKGVVG